MKVRHLAGVSAAFVFALNMAVFGQQAQQGPAPNTSGAQQGSTTEITVTGCVQREADYRKARDAGRGGVAGTGVGAGNEFVLINASAAGAGGGRAAAGAAASGAAGTSGTAGAAYELTGTNEGMAEKFVGQRVEITGMLKAGEVAAGKPTGGPTAGKPPEGVDVLGKDLQLRELDVRQIRASSSGTCAPQ